MFTSYSLKLSLPYLLGNNQFRAVLYMIQIAEREGVHPYGQLEQGLQRCRFVTVHQSQMRTKGGGKNYNNYAD